MPNVRLEDFRGLFQKSGVDISGITLTTGASDAVSKVNGSDVLNSGSIILNVAEAGSDSIIAKLQHSIDNVNWADIPLVDKSSVTLNASNTSASIQFFSEAPHIRLYNTVSGTSITLTAQYMMSDKLVQFTPPTFSGAVSLGSTLGVTGAATFESTVNVTGNITTEGNLIGDSVAGGIQSLSGAGAVDVVNLVTEVTTTGANALTLADGVRSGQLKVIKMVTDGGAGTLTPSNLAVGTTITFDDVGDIWIGYFDGTDWQTVYATATIA